MKLKHPRKVMWAMRDFLNSASELTCEQWYCPSRDRMIELGLDPDDLFAGFCHLEKKIIKKSCVLTKENGFKAYHYWDDEDRTTFHIGYNLEELYCNGLKQFRQDITRRSSTTKGFANVTLALLHELGHLSTDRDENFDREFAMALIRLLPKEERNFAYFQMPDEKAATDWAIEWLQDTEHRKIAKTFEKKFFACFER